MEKNPIQRGVCLNNYQHVSRIMKALVVFLFVSICSMTANTYSQGKDIQLNVKNTRVKDVFTKIEEQSSYLFLLSENIENKLNKKIDVTIDSDSLEEVLELIVSRANLQYEVVDKQVVIYDKQSAPESASSGVEEVEAEPEPEQQPAKRTITGLVTDKKDGLPVIGANVVVLKEKTGTITNNNGQFSLSVPPGATIRISFIGYVTQEIKITDQTALSIQLVEDEAHIDEVVITGYANIRKESFTGSVTQISQEEMLKVSQTDLIRTLEVFDPSIKMVMNNYMGSDPNTLPDFYIRGRSGTPEIKELDMMTTDDISKFALTNNPSAPIFILDGFEVSQSTIYDLDMNRVESVNILKDAAATAVYGSRAANGVIVIETKSLEPGDIRINYSGNLFVNVPDLRSYDLLNAHEMLESEYYAGLYGGTSPLNQTAGMLNYNLRKNDIIRGINTDWISKPLRSELNHKHFFRLEGGSKNVRWGAELNMQNNGGVMKGSYRDVTGATMSIDYRVNRFQVRNRVIFNLMKSENSPYGTFSEYVRMKPYLTPFKEDGETYEMIFKVFYNNVPPNGYVKIKNPLYEASLNSYDTDKYKTVSDNLSLLWYINPYWLLRGTYSISFQLQDKDTFKDPLSGSYIDLSDPTMRGELAKHELRDFNWNANALLSYNQQINNHNLNFSLGVEAAESKLTGIYSYFRGFPVGNFTSMAYAIDVKNKPTYKDNHTRRFGSYLQFNYSLKDIYLFDISGRLDGSSAFGSKKKIANFWSIGSGVNFHNYAFLKQFEPLNRFRVRLTYGHTGKANFTSQQARTTYQLLTDEDYSQNFGMVLHSLGNENLKWEKVQTFNIGTDISFLNNGITLKADYYHAETLDQVADLAIPSSSGFKKYRGNMGEILNEGIDVLLNVRVFQNKESSIYAFVNANKNRNIIQKIGTALKEYNDRVDAFFSQSTAGREKPMTKYEEGNSLTAIYGNKSLGIDPGYGYELFVRRDGTVNHNWSAADQQYLGDTEPKIRGSFGLNASYKNFFLYTSFLYRWGGQAYNQTMQEIENVNIRYYSGDRRIFTNRWKEYGDVVPLLALSSGSTITRPTDRFVQDDNVLTFNSMSVGYDFNPGVAKKIGLHSLRLQLTLEDLGYFSTIRRERGTSYPYARSFNFNVNLSL